jgi:hypothetical protein
MRATVSGSNRSASYWMDAAALMPSSSTDKVRSNFVVCEPTEKGITETSPSTGSPRPEARSCVNMTWNKGVWLRLRTGCNSSTSFSKGTSWCA